MGRKLQTQAQATRDWPAVHADLVRSMGFTLYENPRKYIGWLKYGETRIRVGFDKQACQWIVDLETEILGSKVSLSSAASECGAALADVLQGWETGLCWSKTGLNGLVWTYDRRPKWRNQDKAYVDGNDMKCAEVWHPTHLVLQPFVSSRDYLVGIPDADHRVKGWVRCGKVLLEDAVSWVFDEDGKPRRGRKIDSRSLEEILDEDRNGTLRVSE